MNTNATQTNVGEIGRFGETWKKTGKSCWNWLDDVQTAWLMCVHTKRGFIPTQYRTNTMPTMTNRPRLTSAQFLSAHRRALETISDLHAAIEDMPILNATDPTTMKRFFDELEDVKATVAKLAQHFRTQVCTEEKNSNSF